MMKFRLKQLLERPGAPSQAELARSIGVPRQQINRLVNGDIERIDLKTLDKLYEALDCDSVDELIEYRSVTARRDPDSFRERFIAELVSLTLAPVQDNREEIYTEPSVRQAAERFFDEHISRDIENGGLLASLHARLMKEMKDFVGRHGAREGEIGTADQEHRDEGLIQLVSEIPVGEGKNSSMGRVA